MTTRTEQNCWLFHLPVAHRGLHGDGVPENSLTAFLRAKEAGYAIETDVHLTADGVLVAFHDDNLKRMCGVDKNIKTATAKELSSLTLAGTAEKIPTLDEVLDLVNGAVPLLIELKSNGEKGLERAVCKRLMKYSGAFALQSFDPFILIRVKKIAPDMLRGQLSSFFLDQKFGFLKRTLLKNMYFSPWVKPDFISYDATNLPFKRAKKPGKPLLCWTVRSLEQEKKARAFADNIIFENYLPELPKKE
ncbi:MAG: glycerophosphodiester phosphodiesterase [Clostridia bacterium]|nr:glycerophosphodiester phosphodiesterase [Clostridia bacterium]